MSASQGQQQMSYGDLMQVLLRERDQFATEAEFQAFAMAEVRRFITDLRTINIEVTLRHQYSGKLPPINSPKE